MRKISRRKFSKQLAISASLGPFAVNAMTNSALKTPVSQSSAGKLRLGGPIYDDEFDTPDEWIKAILSKGYSAAKCPLKANADESTIRAYREAAKKANIVIAEVGAWSNPISPNEDERKAAIEKCMLSLELADKIEARCCVNVSGTRGTGKFWGPHPDNLKQETFDMIVETTQKIIDSVKPKGTFFTLEDMPFAFPDSVDSYLDLIKAIDRKEFAVHFDPVNIINSPQKHYDNTALLQDAFKRLGKYMKSCHAKDTLISPNLTLHLEEVVPGRGNLDFAVYLRELSKLEDVPMLMEHIKCEEYPEATKYIKNVGKEQGLYFF